MDEQFLLQISAVVVATVIVLGFWWMMREGGRVVAEQNARFARSTPAQAKVIQIGKSVAQVRNGTTIVKLRLDVLPPGAAPFGATTVWEIQQGSLSQIQPGQVLAVRIDPDDAQRIYPNVGWAEFSNMYWQIWMQNKTRNKQEPA
jgi:hypothetical protein